MNPIDGILAGPDGNVWRMEWNPNQGTPTAGQIVDLSAIGQNLTQKYESVLPQSELQFGGVVVNGPFQEDKNGNIWSGAFFGMGGRGFAEFNPTTGAASFFEAPASADFILGADGSIWATYFSNTGNYIGRFDPATGALESFNEATDAPSAPSRNPATAEGTSFNAMAGIDFKGAVASFTPQTPISNLGVAYQATVNWGDGTTSNLVLTVTANGTYNVVADHAYQTAGTFNVRVTIAPYSSTSGLNADPVTVFSTANVSDNPMDFKPFP